MKKKLKIIKKRLTFILLFLQVICLKFLYNEKKLLFLFGTPWHGNLGDQAIAYSELLYIKRNLSRKVIEIPSDYIISNISIWKKVVKMSDILIQGGGFFGSLWEDEDKMIRTVIENFSENKIIILPQSVFFDKNDTDLITQYNILLDKCKNIRICTREIYSCNLAKKYAFPNVVLIPDMVLYLSLQDIINKKKKSKHETILLCYRNDCEKVLTKNNKERIREYFAGCHIKETNTVISHSIYPFQRKGQIRKKIYEFTKARLIITDRLHGMVFAAISEVPCIVFKNSYHKITGVYKWISNNEYIYFLNDIDQIPNVLDKIQKVKEYKYNNYKVREYFKKLKEYIGDGHV